MARAVWSVRFLAERELAGAAAYTVPNGYTAVLRDADVWIAAPLLSQVEFRILGNEGQTIDWAVCDADTTIVHLWRGRQVFEAGETLTITASDHLDATLSGYLLAA